MVVSAKLRVCTSSHLCSTYVLHMVEGRLHHMPIAVPTYSHAYICLRQHFQQSVVSAVRLCFCMLAVLLSQTLSPYRPISTSHALA